MGKYFSAHGRMVLGLSRLLLRDPVEAEDAAQQVFLSAHKALVAGALPRDPPAWLAAIARNECRARIRARMRAPLELPELPADLPDPLATAINNADLTALWVALSELPRRQRRAFLLRELGGLSYGELGAALGVTRPAVESLLFRARQQVRDALATANVALVPIALRDQLARLIPEFGAGAPSAVVPVAAKVAAVTAGISLGAAGVVALPSDHAGHAKQQRRQQEAVTPQQSSVVAPSSLVGSSSQVAPAIERDDVGDVRREDRRHEREHARGGGERHGDEGVATDEGGSAGGGGGDGSDGGDHGGQGASTAPLIVPSGGSSGPSSPSGGDGGGGSGSGSSHDGGSGHGGSGSGGSSDGSSSGGS